MSVELHGGPGDGKSLPFFENAVQFTFLELILDGNHITHRQHRYDATSGDYLGFGETHHKIVSGTWLAKS